RPGVPIDRGSLSLNYSDPFHAVRLGEFGYRVAYCRLRLVRARDLPENFNLTCQLLRQQMASNSSPDLVSGRERMGAAKTAVIQPRRSRGCYQITVDFNLDEW